MRRMACAGSGSMASSMARSMARSMALAEHKAAAEVPLGEQRVVAVAHQVDIVDRRRAAPRVGVFVMKLEPAGGFAAVTARADKRAAAPVAFDHRSAYLGRDVTARQVGYRARAPSG